MIENNRIDVCELRGCLCQKLIVHRWSPVKVESGGRLYISIIAWGIAEFSIRMRGRLTGLIVIVIESCGVGA